MKASGPERRLLHMLMDREDGDDFLVPPKGAEEHVFSLIDKGMIEVRLTDRGRAEVADVPEKSD